MTGRPCAFTGLPLADLIARRDRLRATLAAVEAATREAEAGEAEVAARREVAATARAAREASRPIVVRAGEVISWARRNGFTRAIPLPEINKARAAMGLAPYVLADAPT